MNSVEAARKLTIKMIKEAEDMHWASVIGFTVSDIMFMLEKKHPLAFKDIQLLIEKE